MTWTWLHSLTRRHLDLLKPGHATHRGLERLTETPDQGTCITLTDRWLSRRCGSRSRSQPRRQHESQQCGRTSITTTPGSSPRQQPAIKAHKLSISPCRIMALSTLETHGLLVPLPPPEVEQWNSCDEFIPFPMIAHTDHCRIACKWLHSRARTLKRIRDTHRILADIQRWSRSSSLYKHIHSQMNHAHWAAHEHNSLVDMAWAYTHTHTISLCMRLYAVSIWTDCTTSFHEPLRGLLNLVKHCKGKKVSTLVCIHAWMIQQMFRDRVTANVMHLRMWVCMYARMHAYFYEPYVHLCNVHVMHVCKYVRLCVCMSVCNIASWANIDVAAESPGTARKNTCTHAYRTASLTKTYLSKKKRGFVCMYTWHIEHGDVSRFCCSVF